MTNNKLYIGDNLTILQTLADKSIDAIITDPPYYTSNKHLTYNDTWKNETQWLDFMRQRLIECRRVLKDTGTILMHIDEFMHIELQQLFYKVFGKNNKLCTFIWRKKYSCSNQSKYAVIEHEYIIAFAKNKKHCRWNGILQFEPKDTQVPFDAVSNKQYNNAETMPNNNYSLYYRDVGFKKTGNINEQSPNQNYSIYTNTGIKYDENIDQRGIYGAKRLDEPLYQSQRFDKCTQNRNAETRPKLYYDKIDGYGEYRLETLSQTGNGSFKQWQDEFSIYGDAHKISLTPFPGAVEIRPMNSGKPGCWRAIPATCQKLIDANMLIVKNNKIYQKQYANFTFNRKTGKLEPFIRTTPVRTILQGEKFPSNTRSNAEIKKIFGSSKFTYAKNSVLVENLLKIISNPGDVVLDIFAGSGTTGGAAFKLDRKFILIQIEENGIPDLTIQRLNYEVGVENYEVKR